MYLNMLISAVIGIVSFSLAMLSNDYYQAPMCIIGKFYANSMLVLINSRMLLGSEEAPSTIISVTGFDATLATTKGSATATHGDLVWAGLSGSSGSETL